MIIELSYPKSELMPNRKNGSHWAKTVAIKKEVLKEAYIITLQARLKQQITLTDTVALKINFMQSDKRKRDLDNLLSASKSCIDGIAQALQIDDKQFQPITITRSYGDVAKMIVELCNE